MNAKREGKSLCLRKTLLGFKTGGQKMSNKSDTRSLGTTSGSIKERLSSDKDGGFIRAYLKKGFLTAAMDALFHARRKAGLTQTQVADKLHTKHASIARWEADTSGSISLHRYAEMALACGMIPLDIKLVPISSLCDYAVENPQASRTADLYSEWLEKKFKPTFVANLEEKIYCTVYMQTCKAFQHSWVREDQKYMNVINLQHSYSATIQEFEGTAQSAEQFLKRQGTTQSVESATITASASQAMNLPHASFPAPTTTA